MGTIIPWNQHYEPMGVVPWDTHGFPMEPWVSHIGIYWFSGVANTQGAGGVLSLCMAVVV